MKDDSKKLKNLIKIFYFYKYSNPQAILFKNRYFTCVK